MPARSSKSKPSTERDSKEAPQGETLRRLRLSGVLIAAMVVLLVVAAVCVNRSPLKPDERVVLFTTDAQLSGDGRTWKVPVHGWIFEPELDDTLRNATLAVVRRKLDLENAPAASELLNERLRAFLVDNQRGKRVIVRVGAKREALPPSDEMGHFAGVIEVSVETAKRYAKDGALTVEVFPDLQAASAFRGKARLVPPAGISVISDIDDTIKVSEVRDKKALLRNTLMRPFEAAPGMAATYRRWSEAGAVFHYVSGSPWQLYEPLVEFLAHGQFPEASYSLKSFRLKDSSVLQLFADPIRTKIPAIEQLLTDYPGRRFCLVGDSGEKDPEIYALMARRHPQRIACIYIRNVTDEEPDGPRFKDVFEQVDPKLWRLFTDPAELPPLP